jgi:hypothetical protein
MASPPAEPKGKSAVAGTLARAAYEQRVAETIDWLGAAKIALQVSALGTAGYRRILPGPASFASPG